MKPNSETPGASFIDLLIDTVFAVDADARVVFVSASCERTFGYTREEMIGKNMFDMMLPEDRQKTRDSLNEIMSGKPQSLFENRYVRKDGQIVHIMWSTRWSPADQLRIGVARDITERKRAESLRAMLYAISEAAYAADDLLMLFQRIHQIIGTLLPVDNFSIALYDNKTGLLSFPYYVDEFQQPPEPFGLSPQALCAEVIHTGQPLLLTHEDMAARQDDLQAHTGKNLLCWLGIPLKLHTGTIGMLAVKSYPGGTCYSLKDQELLQFVSTQIATAIERQKMQVRLKYMAQYDQLTDLPNRGFLYDRLKVALSTARRDQQGLSVLYVDLDKFKQVNDTLGHDVGDLLLQEVAKRLRRCVREADTVARMGGDEFVVMLQHVDLIEQAARVVEKIHKALSETYTIGDHRLNIVPSIGVALYPVHGDNEHQLLRYADQAMYRAKNAADD